MDWKNSLQWSEYCQQHCLCRITPPTNTLLQNCSTSVESLKGNSPFPMNTGHSRTFSVRRPPLNYLHIGHGTVPSTCCLELNSQKGRAYPLSIPEQATMEEYIEEALRQGFICPSTSPATSSFFFVSKKDGGLRPMYQLQNTELTTGQIAISFSSGFSCPRGTPWSSHLLQTGPAKRLQPHSYPSWRRVEDCLHHTYWPLWISSDAVWACKLTISLPGIHERGVPGVAFWKFKLGGTIEVHYMERNPEIFFSKNIIS